MGSSPAADAKPVHAGVAAAKPWIPAGTYSGAQVHTWIPGAAQIIIFHSFPPQSIIFQFHQSLAQFHNLKALATKTLLEQQTIAKTLLQASLQSCKFPPLVITVMVSPPPIVCGLIAQIMLESPH